MGQYTLPALDGAGALSSRKLPADGPSQGPSTVIRSAWRFTACAVRGMLGRSPRNPGLGNRCPEGHENFFTNLGRDQAHGLVRFRLGIPDRALFPYSWRCPSQESTSSASIDVSVFHQVKWSYPLSRYASMMIVFDPDGGGGVYICYSCTSSVTTSPASRTSTTRPPRCMDPRVASASSLGSRTSPRARPEEHQVEVTSHARRAARSCARIAAANSRSAQIA